jgi:hypothetical protein
LFSWQLLCELHEADFLRICIGGSKALGLLGGRLLNAPKFALGTGPAQSQQEKTRVLEQQRR